MKSWLRALGPVLLAWATSVAGPSIAQTTIPLGGDKSPDQLAALAQQLIAGDRFDEAVAILERSATVAKESGDSAQAKLLSGRISAAKEQRVKFLAIQSALQTLDVSPLDEQANFRVGWFYAAAKEDWKRGILMLALGNHADIRRLAIKELVETPSPRELADGWWTVSESIADKTESRQVQRYAAQWYRQALPSLSGFARTKAAARLLEIDPAGEAERRIVGCFSGTAKQGIWCFTDNHRVIQSAQDLEIGVWKRDGERLVVEYYYREWGIGEIQWTDENSLAIIPADKGSKKTTGSLKRTNDLVPATNWKTAGVQSGDRLADSMLGAFRCDWSTSDASGTHPLQFLKNNLFVFIDPDNRNRNLPGAWRIVGDRVIVEFADKKSGFSILQMTDAGAISGLNYHLNGVTYNWQLSRQ